MAKAKAPAEEAPPAEEVVETPKLEMPVADETPETQLATDASSTPAPVVPAAPSFLDILKEEGFADLETPEQAQERLLAAYRQSKQEAADAARRITEQQPYVQYGRDYLEGLRANPQPSAQAPSSPERKDWWTPPKYEAAVAERYREAKPDGGYGWKENTPAEIRAGAEAYQAYVEKWAHDLATNPREALRGLKDEIREELMGEFDNKYKGYRQQETIEEFQDRIRTENDWLFEKDARTQQPIYEKFSAEGQRMDALVSGAMSRYKLPLPDAWEYAKKLYDAEQTGTQVAAVTQQITQQQTNQQAAAAQKQKVLQRGRNLGPNRNGSAPPETEPKARPQNPMYSAGQLLREEMAAGTLT